MAHVRQEAARQLPSHLTPQRTGHKPRTHADSTSATGAQTVHGGDRGWWWVQHERETVRRPTSHERAVHLVAEPPIARVACIFGLTARVRLLAPSAPVPGLAPTQIPPKGGLGPRREGKSGSSQKCTLGYGFNPFTSPGDPSARPRVRTFPRRPWGGAPGPPEGARWFPRTARVGR